MTFNNFNTETDEYDIEFSYTKDAVPDTNLPSYNPLVRLPDLTSWKLWFSSGSVAIYPYITEFIARSKMEKKDFSDKNPIFL